MKIRLVGIDAPETGDGAGQPGQPLSEASRVYLSQMIFKKSVDVVSYGYDIDNRILGVVRLGGENINLRIVGDGMAEVYPGKAPPGFDLDPFRRAEKKARRDKKGIWSLGDRYISPRKWRRRHRKKIERKALSSLPVLSPATAGKKTGAAATGSSGGKVFTASSGPEQVSEPAGEKTPTRPAGGLRHQKEAPATVTGIEVQVGKESEKVLVHLNGFSVPKSFDIDGENPRIVIDVWNVREWKGKRRIPANGRLIRQIRTYLHRKEQKLRIVLDLNVNPYKDYSITQLYDIDKHTYWLEIQ